MKRISILLTILLTTFLSCKKNDSEDKKMNQLGGIWSDVNGPEFTNCYAVFSIKDDSVFVAHYFDHKERPFFEKGFGIIKDDSVIYHMDVIRTIPEWGTGGGMHYLKINEGGDTLRGNLITDSGYKGKLMFIKR